LSSVLRQPEIVFLLVSVCATAAIAAVVYVLAAACRTLARRHDLRRCLASGWWERFERDLRFYESGQWRRARARELHD
jgi:hypothetical protein